MEVMTEFEKRILKKIGRAKEIESEKVVYYSDMHLGTLSVADETLMTKHLIFHSLKWYLDSGYHLVLLGDTFEMAENPNIEEIKNAHDNIMWLFSEFYRQGRLTFIRGNHEEFLKEEDLHFRTSLYDGQTIEWLPNIKIEDAVFDKSILAIHGNEYLARYSTWLNKVIVKLGRFWKWWQLSHHDYHTSESTGWEKADEIDSALNNFAKSQNLHIIAGHTHKCNFKLSNYTNAGTCGVMPRCITGVEHIGNKIYTIKWAEEVDENGNLKVLKTILGEQRIGCLSTM
jgi:UDP-2,3-diacylglucosamine pyrophosphatase LpxH